MKWSDWLHAAEVVLLLLGVVYAGTQLSSQTVTNSFAAYADLHKSYIEVGWRFNELATELYLESEIDKKTLLERRIERSLMHMVRINEVGKKLAKNKHLDESIAEAVLELIGYTDEIVCAASCRIDVEMNALKASMKDFSVPCSCE